MFEGLNDQFYFFNQFSFNSILDYYYLDFFSKFEDSYTLSYSSNISERVFSNSILSIYSYRDNLNSFNNYYLNSYFTFNYFNNFVDYSNLFSLFYFYDDFSFDPLESKRCYCDIHFYQRSFCKNTNFYENIFFLDQHNLHPSQVCWKRMGFTLFDELYNYFYNTYLGYSSVELFTTRNKGIYMYFHENSDTWEIIAEAYFPIWTRWGLYDLYATCFIKGNNIAVLTPPTHGWHLVKLKTIFLEKVVWYNEKGNWWIPEEYIKYRRR